MVGTRLVAVAERAAAADGVMAADPTLQIRLSTPSQRSMCVLPYGSALPLGEANPASTRSARGAVRPKPDSINQLATKSEMLTSVPRPMRTSV